MQSTLNKIQLPRSVNGPLCAGIATGGDSFSDEAYKVVIFMKFTDRVNAKVKAYQDLSQRVLLFESLIKYCKGDQKEKVKDSDIKQLAAYGITIGAGKEVKDYLSTFKEQLSNKVPVVDHEGKLVQKDIRERCSMKLKELGDLKRGYREVIPDIEQTLAANPCPTTDVKNSRLWNGLIFTLLHHGFFINCDDEKNGMWTIIHPLDPRRDDLITERTIGETVLNEADYLDDETCISVIVCAKLNWFLINHHVGQDENMVAKFLGKLVDVKKIGHGNNGSSNEFKHTRSILWALTKVASTTGILSSLTFGTDRVFKNIQRGVWNIHDRAWNITDDIELTDDAHLRTSIPSGTGKQAVPYAIFLRAAMSIYNYFMAETFDFDLINERYQIMIDNREHYHMGSFLLTGDKRSTLDIFTPNQVRELASFIHATASGSTLAKSPAIPKRTEIASDTCYIQIAAARVRNLGTSENAEQDRILKEIAGGSIIGNFAVRSGRITQARLEEILEGSSANGTAAGPPVTKRKRVKKTPKKGAAKSKDAKRLKKNKSKKK
jgi:hypothetical protein